MTAERIRALVEEIGELLTGLRATPSLERTGRENTLIEVGSSFADLLAEYAERTSTSESMAAFEAQLASLHQSFRTLRNVKGGH